MKPETVTGCIWQTYIARHDIHDIGGKMQDSLKLEYVNPLLKVFSSVNQLWQLEFVCDYYGIRYHLLMQENSTLQHCLENTLLRPIATDLDYSCLHEEDTLKCLDLFWPFVAEDSLVRDGKTTEEATMSTRFQKKETVKIQLLTREDGKLSQVFHDERSLYPLSEPIINRCPTTVRVYAMEEIELLIEVCDNVFKAKIGDDVVCVKAAPAKDMESEIDALMRVPHHPNVIHPLLGVVRAEGTYIDKFLIPFIEGKQLLHVHKATVDQKEAWKKQLSEAVSSLHNAGLTWGDAVGRNVMINNRTGEAIVIDFGRSCSEAHEGRQHNAFDVEKKKDLTALLDLREFIDSIATTPLEVSDSTPQSQGPRE